MVRAGSRKKFAKAIKLRPAGKEWLWYLEFKNTENVFS